MVGGSVRGGLGQAGGGCGVGGNNLQYLRRRKKAPSLGGAAGEKEEGVKGGV